MKRVIKLSESDLTNLIKKVLIEQEQGGADEFWAGLIGSAIGLGPNQRQKNINSMVCSTENGIIKNPHSKLNGTKFEDFAKKYKVKNGEYNLALIQCSQKKAEINEKSKLISVLKNEINKLEKDPESKADEIYEVIMKELNDFKNKTGKFNIFIK